MMLPSMSLTCGFPINESVQCKTLKLLKNFKVYVPNFCRDPEFVSYDRPDTTMFAYR